MSLTIDEAIARFEANAEQNKRWANGGLNPEVNAEYAAEHKQLAAWLRELQERRKAPEIIRCGECEFFQCNIRFDGSIPKGADEYECRHWCGGCDPMDYCSYGKRRERRSE